MDVLKYFLSLVMLGISALALYTLIYNPVCAMYMALGALGAGSYVVFLGHIQKTKLPFEEEDIHSPLTVQN